MHEIIKRYADKTRCVNDTALFLFRRAPNRLRQAAVYTLYRLRRNRLPGVRFLIFAQGRSGSTVFVDLMNSHPDVVSFGEIFHENVVRNVRDPRRWAEGLCSLSKKPACGFKVKVYQFERHQNKNVRQTLIDFMDHGWRIVYLKRSNLLRHAISDLRSEKTGLFHVVRGDASELPKENGRTKIHVEWQELEQAIQFRETCLEKEAAALEGLPHILVDYETGILDRTKLPATMNRVFESLGLRPHLAETTFRKVSAREISDDIENFDELEGRILETGYGRFLGWG